MVALPLIVKRRLLLFPPPVYCSTPPLNTKLLASLDEAPMALLVPPSARLATLRARSEITWTNLCGACVPPARKMQAGRPHHNWQLTKLFLSAPLVLPAILMLTRQNTHFASLDLNSSVGNELDGLGICLTFGFKNPRGERVGRIVV